MQNLAVLQFSRYSKSSTTRSCVYDASGMRTQRSNGSTTYNYTYHGSQLTHMTYGSNALHFYYDASGRPLSVVYNGTTYYYILSLQGDVVAVLNSSGVSVVEYTYDAWGRLLTTTGSMAGSLGLHNPLRYRGYVYDQETGLYYLQSRYYNPTICRFINADTFVSTGQGILGYNMFAYCNNNPVKYVDHLGYFGICYALDDPMNVYRSFMTPGMFGGGGGGNTNSGSNGNPYTPTSGGGGVTNSIRIGKFVIDFGHGGRHLDLSNISGLENAIAQDVITKPPTTGYRGEYDIVYGGNIYTYRYWTIGATHINVGTYFPKTPTMVEGR